MVRNLPEITQMHERLQAHAAALFRALDDADGDVARRALAAFIAAVDEHVRADIALGYRLLLRHPSDAVRRVAEHVLRDQEAFPRTFESFVAAWRDVSRDEILHAPFRDDVETLVSDLLKRIRVEGRLVAMLSSVA